MAQIFISHSAKDKRIIEFINRAFASTRVEAKYEEIEAILDGRRTTQPRPERVLTGILR